jgi:hypothetical protein
MRHIITLLLMLPVLADAQIYIDSYRFGIAPDPGFILDTFPGAAAAYSLRKLDNDYTGNCIVVQRDNGDTSAIGFAGNYLDTAAMKTFCGEGAGDSCRVRLWYDQSGNNRFARMDTAARQPLIMVDGFVVREGSRPALLLGGSGANTKLFRINGGSITNNIGAFSAFDLRRLRDTTTAAGTSLYQFTAGSTAGNRIVSGSSTTIKYRAGGRRLDADANTVLESTVNHPGTPTIVSTMFNFQAATLNVFGNGTSVISGSFLTSGNTSATNASGQVIGATAALAAAWLGTITELIFYESDQSTNRAAIETNINTFYSIY